MKYLIVRNSGIHHIFDTKAEAVNYWNGLGTNCGAHVYEDITPEDPLLKLMIRDCWERNYVLIGSNGTRYNLIRVSAEKYILIIEGSKNRFWDEFFGSGDTLAQLNSIFVKNNYSAGKIVEVETVFER